MKRLALLLLFEVVAGGNPLIKDLAVCRGTGGPGGMCGVADPNVHYFEGRFLLFATHDFSVNNTGFRMDDWQVWSSPDLVEWSLESIVRPQDSLRWDTDTSECWATDAAFAGGKYYFYVSAGGGQVGVMVADTPKGPWTDPIGKPLLSGPMGSALRPPTTFRDPCVFNEPGTDQFYIIAGVFTYYVARLGPDMISLAEPPRLVNFTSDVYGPCGYGKTDDKPFLHKQGSTYYLSWGCFYATSSSVYGPFTMQGAVVDTAKIAPDFQCDGQPHQCGAAYQLANPATAPQRARAEALVAYHQRTPQAGDSIMLAKYDSVPASAIGWTQRHGEPGWAEGSHFQVSLTANQSLCVEAHAPMHAGGRGAQLTLQRCDERNSTWQLGARGKLQLFARNLTASGDDVTGPLAGPQHCPCWNVNVAVPTHPAEPDGAVPYLQCQKCVDGTSFDSNQRFTFPSGAGPIRAWGGWAPGWCVAALPPSYDPKPWYLHEDYTDRHGSFVTHGGQWYYFSNDRSHSGDLGHEGSFRDTVGCYIHYRANGTMEPCVIDALGVSQHSLKQSATGSGGIEAENFFAIDGGAAKLDLRAAGGGDGFAISGGHGALIRYLHVTFGSPAQLMLRVATGTADVTLSFQAILTSGASLELCSCPLPATGGLSSFVDVPCKLTGAAAGLEADLVLTAWSEQARLNPGKDVFRLDRFWA